MTLYMSVCDEHATQAILDMTFRLRRPVRLTFSQMDVLLQQLHELRLSNCSSLVARIICDRDVRAFVKTHINERIFGREYEDWWYPRTGLNVASSSKIECLRRFAMQWTTISLSNLERDYRQFCVLPRSDQSCKRCKRSVCEEARLFIVEDSDLPPMTYQQKRFVEHFIEHEQSSEMSVSLMWFITSLTYITWPLELQSVGKQEWRMALEKHLKKKEYIEISGGTRKSPISLIFTRQDDLVESPSTRDAWRTSKLLLRPVTTLSLVHSK